MVFHDRRLQYMEHQQLEGWRWNRPGDRILDIGDLSKTITLQTIIVHIKKALVEDIHQQPFFDTAICSQYFGAG